MPTTRADAARRLIVGASLLSVVGLLSALLGGCGTHDAGSATRSPGSTTAKGTPRSPGSPGSRGRRHGTLPPSASPDPLPDVSGIAVPRDLGQAFAALLDQRASALLAHDRTAFSRTLDPTSSGFVTAQEAYFDNLAQLPITSLSYRVQPASLVRSGTSYWVVVDVALQLGGYDTAPVAAPDRFRFSPTGRGAAYRLSSTTDPAWEAANHLQGQPWDIEPITVRRRAGVLGVFDAGTVRSSARLMASFVRGTGRVSLDVPYGWTGSVVFYALSDDSFVADLGDVPGGDPELLDGVAFSLPAADPRQVAATRVVLNPRVLRAGGAALDRLVRHELTHVAIGTHDDTAPTWLREGLAEWVSSRHVPRTDLPLPRAIVAAARRPGVEMPQDAGFNGPDAALNYAVAWWSCKYLATTYGDTAPWSLLDAVTAPGAQVRSATDGLLGLTPDQLARRGARLLVATYDPPPPSSSGPTTAPSAAPTATPTTGRRRSVTRITG